MRAAVEAGLRERQAERDWHARARQVASEARALFEGGQLEAAVRALEGFARVGEKYGVQTVYQVHSGPVLGSNCSGLMHLLRGLDPRWVGAYPDLGHMVLDGEDYPMGLAMVREYLSIVAVKDAYHAPQPERSEPPFLPRFVKLGSGAVNWRGALGALKALGFDGAFSVHTEYDFECPRSTDAAPGRDSKHAPATTVLARP